MTETTFDHAAYLIQRACDVAGLKVVVHERADRGNGIESTLLSVENARKWRYATYIRAVSGVHALTELTRFINGVPQ